MDIEQINKEEQKQIKAFKTWISNKHQFFNLPKRQQQMLIDYVAGCHREIADLKSTLYHLESTKG